METIYDPRRSELAAPAILRATYKGRKYTEDAAFQFRMGAGFSGMVTRTHPFGAEPCLLDATNPPTFLGEAVIPNGAANSVRQPLAGDTALTDIYGVVMRPFPFQQATSNLNFGQIAFSTSPATSPVQAAQSVDILRQGYILVPLPAGATTQKGGAVFVWVAATGGGHTQGGFEAAATGGSTMAIASTKTTWNGPVDSSTGLAELAFNV